MERPRFRLIIAAALAALPGSALASGAVFFDNTFPAANYSALATYTTNGATIAQGVCPTCGNPSGPALEFVETYNSTQSGVTDEAVANTTWTYDPSTQGAFTEVSASVDKNLGLSATEGGTIASSFHPTIIQDGNIYVASINGLTYTVPSSGAYTTGYATIAASDLTAADFVQFDFTTGTFGTANPNFSATGDAMTIGLTQFGNIDYLTTATVDYDNLSISLGIPEPATWATMLVGFGGLGAVLRRRRALAASSFLDASQKAWRWLCLAPFFRVPQAPRR